MRVLVYGAGVIGALLAHELKRCGQDVTVLARGAWRETLAERGMIIHHHLQVHITGDRLRLIGELDPQDRYDLIFVAVQGQQRPDVLPALAANVSERVVLVGNDLQAAKTQETLLAGDPRKQVAFAFQPTGGYRDGERVIAMHAGIALYVGALRGRLDQDFLQTIKTALTGHRCRVIPTPNMEAWLQAHAAIVLPAAYLCYVLDYDLRRSTSRQRAQVVAAIREALDALAALGVPVPPGTAAWLRGLVRLRLVRTAAWLVAKTSIGELAAADHCRTASAEMVHLDAQFDRILAGYNGTMPAWRDLRAVALPIMEQATKQKAAMAPES